MEENYTSYNEPGTPALSISAADKIYLRETKKWAKFLAILGFILSGLMVLGGLGVGTFMGSFSNEEIPIPGFLIGLFYALFGLIYFFPSLYLYRYGTNMETALARNDNQALTEAFKNEKSMYKFWAILVIIMLVFYGLAIIGMMFFAMMKS